MLKKKIEWEFMDFGLDLQPTIDLIEQPSGLFSLLDDAVAQKATDDIKLREEFNRKHGKKTSVFKLDKFDQKIFNIVHYAGEVPYNVESWLIKNVDPMNDDCAKCFYESKSKYVSYLFKDFADQKRRGGSAFQTVAKEYKSQLNSLMEKLTSTEPHFIRCIIPNHIQKAGILDSKIVLDQLKCNGVLEGIRISRKGYPGRIQYPQFVQRYHLLCTDSELKNEQTQKGKSSIIIKKSKIQEKKRIYAWINKSFFKNRC